MELDKTSPEKPWGLEINSFCVLMHLSTLFFWPLSIIMWATNKDSSETINLHGKNIANFLISFFIYYSASGLLIFVLVGLFTTGVLSALFVVFPIIAAIKAGKGLIYSYPLTIKIIK